MVFVDASDGKAVEKAKRFIRSLDLQLAECERTNEVIAKLESVSYEADRAPRRRATRQTPASNVPSRMTLFGSGTWPPEPAPTSGATSSIPPKPVSIITLSGLVMSCDML